jgi:hypothetical protein
LEPDFEGAVRGRILTTAATLHLADNRVTWGGRPQDAGLDAITLHVISDPRPQHLKGFQDLRETLVQIDCDAVSHRRAKILADAVVDALVPEAVFGGITFDRSHVDDVRTGGTQTSTNGYVYRRSIDLRVWWRAS